MNMFLIVELTIRKSQLCWYYITNEKAMETILIFKIIQKNSFIMTHKIIFY